MSSFPNDIRKHCLSPEQRAGSLGLGSSCRKWGLEPGRCSAGRAMLGFLGTWGVGCEVLWERSLSLTMAGGRGPEAVGQVERLCYRERLRGLGVFSLEETEG